MPLKKVRAAMGKPVYVIHPGNVQIFVKRIEPKTTAGRRRIHIAIRVPNKQWRNHHVLQYPFGLDVQYVNVLPGEN
jgi:hypothetical protein